MIQKKNQIDIITTKFGDNGMTNLVHRNVSKTDPIIACIGRIDHANAQIGAEMFLYKHVLVEFKQILHNVQNQLFDLSADLICNTEKICDVHIEKLLKIAHPTQDIKFSPLQASINAVEEAKSAFDAYDVESKSKYPRGYLTALSGVLRYLSHYIFVNAPWCACVSQVINIVEKINLTEFLCGKFMEEIKHMLSVIKNDLHFLREDLMYYGHHISEVNIAKLEDFTKELNKVLPPLTSFVLPIGPSAPMHNVRTSVRIAEIGMWNYFKDLDEKAGGYSSSSTICKYMNRLSDLIFVMCRRINYEAENSEDLWVRIGNE